MAMPLGMELPLTSLRGACVRQVLGVAIFMSLQYVQGKCVEDIVAASANSTAAAAPPAKSACDDIGPKWIKWVYLYPTVTGIVGILSALIKRRVYIRIVRERGARWRQHTPTHDGRSSGSCRGSFTF